MQEAVRIGRMATPPPRSAAYQPRMTGVHTICARPMYHRSIVRGYLAALDGYLPPSLVCADNRTLWVGYLAGPGEQHMEGWHMRSFGKMCVVF